MTPIAELRGVTLRYAGLAGLDLTIPARGVTALLGPSGSGKSSALRLLMGLAAPDDGQVVLEGRVASDAGRVLVPPEDRRLGVVFQDLALWPHLSVRENFVFGLRARGVAPAAGEARVDLLLAQLGLAAKADRRPGELSGGERQRVAIGRALVLEPALVLLDEPLSNLDVALKDELLALFANLLRARPVAALYVTHDPREADVLADRVAVLEAGRVTQFGMLSEILAAPATAFARHVARTLRPVATKP